MESEQQTLTPVQLATEYIQHTSCNIFLTGKAGTGKTTFLHEIVQRTYKNVVITAPTGIAAINAGGVTLHSFFQLPFGSFVPENRTPDLNLSFKLNDPVSLIRNLQIRDNKRRIIRNLELLVIDEVSMLRADLLDAVDVILKHIRRNKAQAFGGVQVLFIGDMYQLPPVIKDDEWQILHEYYSSPFFFDSKVLREHKPLYIELDKIYRQDNPLFIRLLNNLRNNALQLSDSELLQKFYKPGFKPNPNEKFINLTTHNIKANQRNSEELERLNGKSYHYEAIITGDFSEYLYPVERELVLKVRAQVMFIKNDPTGERRFFNGKIGEISSLSDEEIEVTINDKEPPVIVERYQWENVRYELNEKTQSIEEKVIGTFSQYPLRLAWAITVHKSQGLTFDKAIIDVNEAFAPGQIYVALSRLRSLDGLVLTSVIQKNKLQVNNQIYAYSQNRMEVSELKQILKIEKDNHLHRIIYDSFSFSGLIKLAQELAYHSENEEAKTAKLKYRQWSGNLISQLKEFDDVASKFQHQITFIFNQKTEESRNLLLERIKAAEIYFSEKLLEIQKDIFSHIAQVMSDKRVKTYLREIFEFENHLYTFQVQMKRNVMLAMANFNNQPISKNKLASLAYIESRVEQLREVQVLEKLLEKGYKKKKRKNRLSDDEYTDILPEIKRIPKKDKKTSSPEITLAFFREGRNIEEIAEKRNFTVDTIARHLIPFVKSEEIAIEKIIDSEKIHKIKSVLDDSGFNGLKELKDKLPEEISYIDIRIVLASLRYESNDDVSNDDVSNRIV